MKMPWQISFQLILKTLLDLEIQRFRDKVSSTLVADIADNVIQLLLCGDRPIDLSH